MTRATKQAGAPVAAASGDEPMLVLEPIATETSMLSSPTLRDQIAMRAPSIPAWWTNTYMARSGSHSIDAQALAAWAYEYADAMLVERAQ